MDGGFGAITMRLAGGVRQVGFFYDCQRPYKVRECILSTISLYCYPTSLEWMEVNREFTFCGMSWKAEDGFVSRQMADRRSFALL